MGPGIDPEIAKMADDMKRRFSISLILPWPPSINHYYRTWRNRTVISADGRKYRDAVHAEIYGNHVPEEKIAKLPITGRVSIVLLAYPPNKRRRDIDNLLKPTLDALTKSGVWLDDEQVDRIEIERMDGDAFRSDGGAVLAYIIERKGEDK